MKIAVTGVTGYIGRELAKLSMNRGYEIVAASRMCPPFSVSSWIPFDLYATSVILLPIETKAIVHLAADVSSADEIDGERELVSIRALIAASKESMAKLLFVSSQTARPDAPTAYGRKKWRVEQEVLAAGGWVVRPGQVYGGPERGLNGELVNIVRRLPVLPAFLPAPNVQPIHVDDLAEGLLRIIEYDDIPPGVLQLASPKAITFTKFLSLMASARVRRKRFFVPIPTHLFKVIIKHLGVRLRTRLGLDRLRSLLSLPLMDTVDDLQRLNLSLRPLLSGMHPSGNDRRRRLLLEGKSFLGYVLKGQSSSDILRHYVRAVEKLRDGTTLNLPLWILKRPLSVALLDDRSFTLSKWGSEFMWRLDAATALAEASKQGACRFLGVGQNSGMLNSIICILRVIVSELIWRLLRLPCSIYFKRSKRGSGLINEAEL